jgi:hypothetical protein
LKINDNTKQSAFSDVSEDFWAKQYIDIAYSVGIVNGETLNNFGVGNSIFRQDLSVMIYRALIYQGYKFDGIPNFELFDDNNSILEYSIKAVYALKKVEILEGENNLFRPNDIATRAEVAKVICKVLDLIDVNK